MIKSDMNLVVTEVSQKWRVILDRHFWDEGQEALHKLLN